jgi:hypothetical protein
LLIAAGRQDIIRCSCGAVKAEFTDAPLFMTGGISELREHLLVIVPTGG